MKTMFDTSVLIAALTAHHQHHSQAAPWLQRAHAGEFPWFIAAHSLAECYATLTAKVKLLGVGPDAAAIMIRDNLMSQGVNIIDLTSADYAGAIQRVAGLGLSSGIIYDAILVAAAQKAGVERLFTFNTRHFLQVWSGGNSIIRAP